MRPQTMLGPWICTIDGQPFYYQAIDVAKIRPSVIAHALSNICRYNGHVDEFYSVAQHCVLVSRNVPLHLAMEGLMHDAAEAFVGDMVRPLKDLVGDAYRHIEETVETAIAGRFQLRYPWPPEIKRADVQVFHTEVRDLTPQSYRYPHEELGLGPLPDKIIPWGPHVARQLWLKRYLELGGV